MKRILVTILISICATAAFAQSETEASSRPAAATTTATTTTETTTAPTTTNVVMDTDAATIRHQFRELLERHPPSVGRVLKLDPTLFKNTEYLSNYPALSAFLAAHPEIAHTPPYYLESVYVPGDTPARTASERMWSDMMEGIAIFFTMSLVIVVLTWIVRTLVEHRRWSRQSKIQSEVHNKLMDRFSSNEELTNYIQSPAGKRFLESAPLQLDAGPARPAPAPASRILWSVQIGVIIFAAGVGLQFLSSVVDKEVSQPPFAMGVLAISLGLGFVLSAFLSFVLSRKLGLWPGEPSGAANE